MKVLKNYSISRILFYILFLVVLITLVVLENVMPRELEDYTEECVVYPNQFEWIKADGSRELIDVPGNYDIAWGEPFVIETELPAIIKDRTYLMFRSSQETANVYIDGILRTKYDTRNTRCFGDNTISGFVMTEVSHSDEGKVLRIELTSKSHFSGLINEVLYGSEMNLWYKVVVDNAIDIVVIAFMSVLGIVAILLGCYFRIRYKEEQQLLYMGWIIFLTSAIMVCESHLRQLFIRNVSALADSTYYLVVFLYLVIIFYLDIVQKKGFHKVYSILSILGFVDALFVYISVSTKLMEYYNTLYIVIPLFVILFVTVAITFAIDVKNGTIKDYKGIIIGLIVYMVVCLLGYIMVEVLDILDSLGTFFSPALIILLIPSISKTIRDITNANNERHRIEEEKRVEEKYFACIAHEIRTPINGVLGMNEMIREISRDARIDEYSHNIKNSGKILLSLVNDLLDISKIKSGKMTIITHSYSVKTLIEDCVNMIYPLMIDKKLELELLVRSNLPSVLDGDEVRIKQILTNLLSNAVKYTKEGTITLTVEGVGDEDAFTLYFSVADTGQGISEENIPYLFDAFTRFENSEDRHIEGTGLGLAITNQLIKLMHGLIKVESKLGKGSRFSCLIPQIVVDNTPIGNLTLDSIINREKKTFELKNKTRFLVVDDNELNLVIMEELLRDIGAEVETALSGKEAIEKSKHKVYDIIFMDHMMPGMDGIEATKVIKNDEANVNYMTSIVALTANCFSGIKEYYLSEGFADFVSKPIEIEELEKCIEKLLN